MEKQTIRPEMLLAAMEAVSDGVVIVDADSRIVYLNEAYTQILDVRREQVLYRRIADIEPGAMILEALADRKPRRNQLVEVKTRGKTIMVNIAPIFQGTHFIGAVSVFKDITEITQAQQELKRVQQQSHHIFKALSHEENALPPEFSGIIGQDPAFIRCLKMAAVVLAQYFLESFSQKYQKKLSLSPAACQLLQQNPWSGNVRQLESCMEYAVIVAMGPEITAEDLPEEVKASAENGNNPLPAPAIKKRPAVTGLKADIQQIERERMRQALAETKGNKTQAMKLLGISRRTFYKKYKLYGFTS